LQVGGRQPFGFRHARNLRRHSLEKRRLGPAALRNTVPGGGRRGGLEDRYLGRQPKWDARNLLVAMSNGAGAGLAACKLVALGG
jgi:hypothetical protein